MPSRSWRKGIHSSRFQVRAHWRGPRRGGTAGDSGVACVPVDRPAPPRCQPPHRTNARACAVCARSAARGSSRRWRGGLPVARRVAHATQFPFLSASQPALQLCSGVCSDGAAHRGLCHPDRTVLPLEVKFGADSFNTLILMISACVGLVSPSDPTLQCSLPHCEGPPPRHASPRPRVPSSRRVCPRLLWVPQRRHFAAATVR